MKYSKLMIPVAALFVLSSCSQSITGNAAGNSQGSSAMSSTTSSANTQTSRTSSTSQPDNKTKQIEIVAPVNSEKAATPAN